MDEVNLYVFAPVRHPQIPGVGNIGYSVDEALSCSGANELLNYYSCE